METHSNYTKSLYDLVQQHVGKEKRGRIKLDLADTHHYACVAELFGGEENLLKNYPRHHSVIENTRSAAQLSTTRLSAASDSSTGFADFSRICSLAYNKAQACLSTFSYANLAGKAKSIYLTVTVFRQGKEIDFNSGFTFQSSNATIETEAEKVVLSDAEGDDILVIFHVAWQKGNMMYSAVNYEMNDTLESSLDVVVKEINVIDPRNKNTPADSNIIVTFGRTPDAGEAVDYPYPESRLDSLQRMLLELRGEVTLVDGAKLVNINNRDVGIVLNHPTLGTIFYNADIPASSFKQITENKFSWDIAYDWNNVIPSSILAGIREYSLDMCISFSAVKPNQSRPTNHTIEVASSDKSPSPHFKKINKIKVKWGCLVEGSLIRMADGREQAIQNIRIGDLVNTDGGIARVLNVWRGMEDEILVIKTNRNSVIRLTETHPLMTKNGLMPAIELNFGDELLMENGNYESIHSFYMESFGRMVYNLDVEGSHTFICNGFVVGGFEAQNSPRMIEPCLSATEEMEEEALRCELSKLAVVHERGRYA